MNIFMSWSGKQSGELGKAFHDWLPTVIQSIIPYFTPDETEKGSLWDSQITQELQQSNVGLFFLTIENTLSPWIMFEAGSLSKNIDRARICPILFGIKPTDLQGPLARFQACVYDKEDIKKLLINLNHYSGDEAIKDVILEKEFDMWWPMLDGKINDIMKNYKIEKPKILRDDRQLLEEILIISRRLEFANTNITPSTLSNLREGIRVAQDYIDRGSIEFPNKILDIIYRKLGGESKRTINPSMHLNPMATRGFLRGIGATNEEMGIPPSSLDHPNPE